MAMASPSNNKKFRGFDVSGVYNLKGELPDTNEPEIHWSHERFWCLLVFEECYIRRYTLLEIEDLEENDY